MQYLLFSYFCPFALGFYLFLFKIVCGRYIWSRVGERILHPLVVGPPPPPSRGVAPRKKKNAVLLFIYFLLLFIFFFVGTNPDAARAAARTVVPIPKHLSKWGAYRRVLVCRPQI